MSSVIFRKTLLALAITATALPAYAEILELNDTGLVITGSKSEPVEVAGNFSGTHDLAQAIKLDAAQLDKGLILNATAHNEVNADSLLTDHRAAVLIANSTIQNGLANKGTLSIKNPHVPGSTTVAAALRITGTSTINGKMINASGGKILAEGAGSSGILLEGATLTERLINNGQVQVDGREASGIKLTELSGTASPPKSKLTGLTNTGSITAQGKGSKGLDISGTTFTTANQHIVNTGHIASEGTAIHIGSGNTFADPKVKNLEINNSGTLIGGEHAIYFDDTGSNASQIVLNLNDGSKITGNLTNMGQINMLGDVQLDGDIMMKTGAAPVSLGDAKATAHLELGKAHTMIDSNLEVAKGSSIGLNLSQATDATKPVVLVTNRAIFGQDSQIIVGSSARNFSTEEKHYTLLESTQGMIDRGLSVSLDSQSPLLNFTSNIDAANNKVEARIGLKSEADIARMVAVHGASDNSQQGLVRLTHDGVLSKLDANDALLQNIATADEKKLATLAQQLTPEVNGGASKAATTGQTLIANAASARTSAVRGLSSGDAATQTGLWMQTLYSDATQGNRDGIAGYDAHSSGMAFGADAKLNDQFTLGVAYSFLSTDVNGSSGNKTEVDAHAFTLYGGLEHGNYFADASLTYGKNNNESERHIAGTKAKADYDSTLLGLNLIGGYTYQMTEKLLVEPRLAARYSLVDIDSYREKGSSAALQVSDQRFEAIELGAGLRVAANFPLGKGTLTPQAKLMGYHDFAADQSTSTSTFMLGNTPFVTSGAKPARNSVEAGVGADYRLGAVTLGLNYDYVGKSDFDADTLTAKVRYEF